MSKATKILLAAALALGGLIVSVAAEIPEDLRSTANTWAFLASMGQRCETRLEWQGYAGVNDEVCQDFQDQYTRVSTEFSAQKEALKMPRELSMRLRVHTRFVQKLSLTYYTHNLRRQARRVSYL